MRIYTESTSKEAVAKLLEVGPHVRAGRVRAMFIHIFGFRWKPQATDADKASRAATYPRISRAHSRPDRSARRPQSLAARPGLHLRRPYDLHRQRGVRRLHEASFTPCSARVARAAHRSSRAGFRSLVLAPELLPAEKSLSRVVIFLTNMLCIRNIVSCMKTENSHRLEKADFTTALRCCAPSAERHANSSLMPWM